MLEYKKWMAFKKFLLDFGRFNEKELPEISRYEVTRPKAKISISSVYKPSGNKKIEKPILKPVIQATVKASAIKNTSGTSFGDIPSTEDLLTPGMAKIDLSIKWIDKQKEKPPEKQLKNSQKLSQKTSRKVVNDYGE